MIRSKNPRNNRILISIFLSTFFVFFANLNLVRMTVVTIAFAVSIGVIIKSNRKALSFNKMWLLFQLAIMLFSATRFFEYWRTSARIEALASTLSLNKDLFLVIVSAVAICASFYSLNLLIDAIWDRLSVCGIIKLLDKNPFTRNVILQIILILLQFAQLQRSSLDFLPNVFRVEFKYFILNIIALLSLNLLLMLLLRREKISAFVASTAVTMFSIANYYVILFHGNPILPSEFANARTALNVMTGYQLTLSPQITDVVAVFLAELFLTGRFTRLNWKGGILYGGIAVCASCYIIIYTAFFSPIGWDNMWQFSWNASIMYNGFFSNVAYNLKSTIHPLIMPKDYDDSAITIPTTADGSAGTEYPDIILIMNESFCDLDYYSSVQADSDYLGPIYHLENASHGIAFAPDIGGGTNDSEFELLTSCSMKLLAASSPFNYIHFSEEKPTAVTYLKSLGYTTTAMHNSTPQNYSRHIAYPAMGFDHVYLGENTFSVTNYNGNRPVLDADDYAGMVFLYEKNVDAPRFYYLLTYQNHGGWEQNDACFDTVHTTKDLGSFTDDLNEYLTSISLSAKAFHDLTDYFASSKRPVIICMVGDHAPSFINQLEGKSQISADETELKKRAVPYVVWTNFDCELPDSLVLSSMTDLFPQLLSYCGMPLTPYYQHILELHEIVPVRTRYGICLAADGNVFQYDEEAPVEDPIKQYYFMEYNGIAAANDYLPELFRIP